MPTSGLSTFARVPWLFEFRGVRSDQSIGPAKEDLDMKRKTWLRLLVLSLSAFLISGCGPEWEQLSQLLNALHENQSSNAEYAKFLSDLNAKTPFIDYYRIYDSVAAKKNELSQRLQKMRPDDKYSVLYERLQVSVQADEKLMAMEKESLQQLVGSLGAIETMGSILKQATEDYADLSEEVKRLRSMEALNRAREFNRQWLDQLKKTSAALDSARTISSMATQLLNDEIERLGVPIKQDNPFIKNPASAPASSGGESGSTSKQ